jgi:hypothetical protein
MTESTAYSLENSAVVLDFLRDYNRIWLATFPELRRTGHWELVTLLSNPSRKDGFLIDEIHDVLHLYYKLDIDTTISRLTECKKLGFLTCDSDNPSVSTPIFGTDNIRGLYDRHVLVGALAWTRAVAQRMGFANPPESLVFSDRLRSLFVSMQFDLIDGLKGGSRQLLRMLDISPAYEREAFRNIRTVRFWPIFAVVLRHECERRKNPQLLPISKLEILEQVLPILKVNQDVVDERLKDLEKNWKLFERANADKKYRVTIPEAVFAPVVHLLSEKFERMSFAARELIELSEDQVRDERVVQIAGHRKWNDSLPVISRKRGE